MIMVHDNHTGNGIVFTSIQTLMITVLCSFIYTKAKNILWKIKGI